MLQRLLLSADPNLEFRTYPVLFGELPGTLDECDAYVISGSRFSVFDGEAWIEQAHDFIRRLHQHKKKSVGICFGHQLIASALGGRVERALDRGWGVGVHNWKIHDQPEWMRPPLSELSLLAIHQDQVYDLPAGGRLLASSDFCPIAVFQVDDHFLAIQGHPEFSPEFADALFDLRQDLVGSERADAARRSVGEPIHDAAVAAWIMNFLAAP